ncbi:hypothetical protein VNI00_004952 [Paramarasmius palmivorus]|uniref:Uncharacterized protein n=1 Tax=Paramarasmius palmivorus TaxID=297713 RepID=A0AAW0DEA2_9AGAR
MVKDIIPRPSVLRPSSGNGVPTARGASIGQILLNSNIFSAQAFKEFKAFVRQTATECLPDTFHKHHEYDAVLWREVLDRVVQKYPILKQCARLWPVDAYFDTWVTNGRYRTNWLTKKRDSIATNSGGVERRSVKLGAEQVARKRTPMKRESSSAHARNMVEPIKREEYGPLIPFQSTDPVSQLHYTPNIVARARTYPEACFSCGAFPHIIDEDRLELRNFLAINNLTDMAPAISSFGILHDGHLEILTSLSTSDRDKIISGMSRFLARPDMVEFRKHLNTAAGVRKTLVCPSDSTISSMSPDQHHSDILA